jgi:hypothetical protein
MGVQWWVCWLMLAAATRADVGERLTMAVSPAQSFAPTTLTIRVHVKPDAENRALEIVAESGDYYRSSRIPLDGNEAPRTIVVERMLHRVWSRDLSDTSRGAPICLAMSRVRGGVRDQHTTIALARAQTHRVVQLD